MTEMSDQQNQKCLVSIPLQKKFANPCPRILCKIRMFSCRNTMFLPSPVYRLKPKLGEVNQYLLNTYCVFQEPY